MDIDKIKEKIKKLLALAKSPNPNEAATALKMAQEMMSEYNINTSSINVIDISENEIKAPTRKKPPQYEAFLIRKIAAAFGCQHFYDIEWDESKWVFIGLKHRTEVAVYISEVLLRKNRTARKNYIKTMKRVRLAQQKTKRADEFCFYWIYAVTEKLPEFAGISDEEKNAIEEYKYSNYPNLEKFTPRSRSGSVLDRTKGYDAGKDIQLQHGVSGQFQSTILLGA